MADKRKAAAEAAAATAAKAEEKGETKAEGPPAKILDSLEEDDEFEEFENQNWGEDEKDAEDAEAWGDDWEDQATEDDFIGQLRAELEKNA